MLARATPLLSYFPTIMKKLLASLLLLLSVALVPLRAEITPEKEKEIRRMLELMGTAELMNQMMDQMIGGMSSAMGTPSTGFWDKFREKVNPNELITLILPVYDKYYTLEDLQAANQFYASPAGQRILKVLPQVTQESMVIGQQWGEKMAQQALAEIKAEKEKAKATSGAKVAE